MVFESPVFLVELTENEKEVLIDVLEMTKDDLEDESWWPDGDWNDEDERYMMQKHEVCTALLRKLGK